MPITFSIDPIRHLVTAIVSGEMTYSDIREHLCEEKERQGLSYPEIVDARTAQVNLTSSEVRGVMELLRGLGRDSRLGPTAVIVSTDLSYGVMRMLEFLTDDVCAIRPFRKLEDANSWLGNSDAA